MRIAVAIAGVCLFGMGVSRAGGSGDSRGRAAGTRPAADITVDASGVPDMAVWAGRVQAVADAEYPKIGVLLPSGGFVAPARVRIVIDKDMDGVAATTGSTIHLAAGYFRAHPEDVGAVVHELAHVVQHYQGRTGNAGWLVEGIADWVRFYHYEPVGNRPVVNPRTADYRQGYRTAAAFLEWMDKTYGPNLVVKINAALRGGRYQEAMFQELTGKPRGTLWAEYLDSLRHPATRG